MGYGRQRLINIKSKMEEIMGSRKNYMRKWAVCFTAILFMVMAILPAKNLMAASLGDQGTPSGAPAAPALSHNNWDGRGTYEITFNIWWGNNATSYKLYEDNAVIQEGDLEANSPNAQSKVFSIQKTENGTYQYKLELANTYGTTGSNTISVSVTNAGETPDKPEEPDEPKEETVEIPQFSVAGGTYTKAQTVEITCKTKDAVIRYTTDGTNPDKDAAVYSKPISIEKDTTLKAKAFKEGMLDSAVASAGYIIRESGNTDPVKPTEGLQKRLLIGYWHTWGGSAAGGVPFVKLRDVDKNWDVINVSFAEPVSAGSTDGRMKFEVSGLTADYTVDDFKADIKALQAEGKKIVLSIGGYEGYFSLTSESAVKQFVSDIKGFVDEYGFDGIDIDLEQSSVTFNSGADPDYKNPVSPKIVYMIQAIREICDSYGNDFILSWAPETFYVQLGFQFYGGLNQYCDSRAGVYLPMIHALRDKTSYVHVQLYNSMAITGSDGKSYTMGTTEGAVAMCKMLLEGFNLSGNADHFFEPLRADQVVIGVPSSAGAAGSGHISNENLQKAFSALIKDYPDLRGIMTWSINWDAYQNNNSFAKSNGLYLDGLQN